MDIILQKKKGKDVAGIQKFIQKKYKQDKKVSKSTIYNALKDADKIKRNFENSTDLTQARRRNALNPQLNLFVYEWLIHPLVQAKAIVTYEEVRSVALDYAKEKKIPEHLMPLLSDEWVRGLPDVQLVRKDTLSSSHLPPSTMIFRERALWSFQVSITIIRTAG